MHSPVVQLIKGGKQKPLQAGVGVGVGVLVGVGVPAGVPVGVGVGVLGGQHSYEEHSQPVGQL